MNSEDESFDSEPYSLPADLNRAAIESGWALARSLDEISGRYLVQRRELALSFQDGASTIEVSSADIARFLNQLRPMAMDSADPPKQDLSIRFTGSLGTAILRFVDLFLMDLRAIICKRGKGVSGTSQAVIVALSSWLASKVGVQPHLATAVATAILAAVLTATKGAFCKMTASQAKAALASARTAVMEKKGRSSVR